MSAFITRTLLILFLGTVMTGCKFALMVTADGDVSSSSGTRDCYGGSICEFEITDTDFSETFTATARAGYVFSKWQAGDGYICANSPNPVCVVSNVPAAGIPVVDAFILTGAYFYAKPTFTFVGLDTDDDGTADYLDEDDDNDGVLAPDDNCPLEGPNVDGFGCPAIEQSKTVFVISETYTGNLGGLTGADEKCNTLAAAASLPGTYKAWLSTSNGSPSTRFVQSSIPYKLVDGTVIAEDYADLVQVDAGLRHQGSQTCDEIHRLECHLRGAIPVGLGDAFQSGIRPVEWTDGANHEGFATLLRADGDPIRHGTASAVAEHSLDEYVRTFALLIIAHFTVDAMEEPGELMALIADNSLPGSLH